MSGGVIKDTRMNKFLALLQELTIGPMERHRRATVAQDKVLAYPLFRIAMSAKSKLDKCEPLLREISDLNLEQPVPLELRVAVKECLRQIEKEDKLCP